MDKILQCPGSGYARFGGAQSTASTGYGVFLFDTNLIDNTNRNWTDAPIFWYAEILLNYAEACAELGTITRSDLDKSINLLPIPDDQINLNPQAVPLFQSNYIIWIF